ncbi:MAG: hypothetical protein RBT64_08665 [Trichloromonas sp.]|jgi:hypothetical protein|nr:hypothetical protein [Trichloromonas sp.]
MKTFILSLIIFLLSFAGLAAGLLLGRREPRRTRGGGRESCGCAAAGEGPARCPDAPRPS